MEGYTFSDANATLPAGTTYAANIKALSAARTVTLPAANSVPSGTVVMVKDETNTASATNTITVNRAGADTINGGATGLVINGVGGNYVRLVSDGVSAWTGAVGVALLPSRGAPIYSGYGSPLNVVAAPVGSLYLRQDGGASTTLYVKETGTGNTGWTAK